METLAIVAYRQPIMRAEVEAIRGVASGEVLRGLLERRLVKIVGRAEELGRPMLYGTTKEFLKVFGLSGLDDLPAVEGLEPETKRKVAKPAVEEAAPPAQTPENPAAPEEND
jgi:segregation and condensation protein B